MPCPVSSASPVRARRTTEVARRLPSANRMSQIPAVLMHPQIPCAISGKRRTDHKLYFPQDFIEDLSTKRNIKKKIQELLEL